MRKQTASCSADQGAFFEIDSALEGLRLAEVCLEMLREENNTFRVNNAAEAGAAQERIVILARALENEMKDVRRALERAAKVTQAWSAEPARHASAATN